MIWSVDFGRGGAAKTSPVVRDVYLPARRLDRLPKPASCTRAHGQSFRFDYQSSGRFELPFLVRRGAILPDSLGG